MVCPVCSVFYSFSKSFRGAGMWRHLVVTCPNCMPKVPQQPQAVRTWILGPPSQSTFKAVTPNSSPCMHNRASVHVPASLGLLVPYTVISCLTVYGRPALVHASQQTSLLMQPNKHTFSSEVQNPALGIGSFPFKIVLSQVCSLSPSLTF